MRTEYNDEMFRDALHKMGIIYCVFLFLSFFLSKSLQETLTTLTNILCLSFNHLPASTPLFSL